MKKNLTDRQARILAAALAACERYGKRTAWNVNIVIEGGRRASARELRALAEKVDGVEFVSEKGSQTIGYGIFGRQGWQQVSVTEPGLRFVD